MENQEGSNDHPGTNKISRRLAIALGIISSMTGAMPQESNVDDPFAKESHHKITREYEATKMVRGEDYIGATNLDDTIGLTDSMDKDVSVVLQHNIRMPESLADLGKMLIEPLSVSISIPYGKDNAVAKVRTMLGYKDGEPQIVDIEIPYTYAEHFDTADPKDREKMRGQAREDAEKLFEKILTTTFGPSFFKKEAEEHHREFGSPLTKVNTMDVEGYASPETADGINTNDIRNQKLSKLRAENATEIISELFKEKNIGVDEIYFQGKGEVVLSPQELKKLAAESVQLDLADRQNPESEKVLKIIQQYDDHRITNQDALRLLEETVGSKRKVAVHMEINEEKKILVLPIPALLLLGYAIKKGSGTWENRGGSDLPHSFIRSEDPSRPMVRVPHITREGRLGHHEIERVNMEANRFFAGYTPSSDAFFIVSGNEEDSLETANVYRLTAEERGLEVIRPEHARNERDDITHGSVRVLSDLSIERGDTAEDLYNREFKNLIRLLNFGEGRIREAQAADPLSKRIHILAFGQDVTVIHALERFFRERNIDNLEVIEMRGTRNPERALGRFRGKTRRIR